MPSMKKIVECVPNFSEGRDLAKLEKILEPFRGKEGVKLLDYQNDEDHNRAVVTIVGEPDPLKVQTRVVPIADPGVVARRRSSPIFLSAVARS